MAEAEGEDEPSDADEQTEGGEVAEGVDAGGAAEQMEDEAVSALVMEDPTSSATAFAEAIAASGLEVDNSPITTPAAGFNAEDSKWTLADLFDVGVVGKLAPMTLN
jgi:hypothetical protein